MKREDPLISAASAAAKQSRRSMIAAVALLVFVTASIGLWTVKGFWQTPDPEDDTDLYRVDSGPVVLRCDFTAIVTSSRITDILCQVAAHRYGDNDFTTGAQLLWIVPDGTLVQAEDLLLELDATQLKDLRDDWQLQAIKSEGHYEQVRLQYENETSKRETELANTAEKLQTLLQLEDRIDEAQQAELSALIAVIEQTRQEVKLAEAHAEYTQAADREGLIGGTMDSVAEASLKHQLTLKDLSAAVSEFSKLTEFDQPNKQEQMAAAILQMRRVLLQTQHDYDVRMRQLRAECTAAKASLDRQREKVEQYTQQVAACEVRAPFSGLVEHLPVTGEPGVLEPGITLRERQRVLRLYDMDQLRLQGDIPANLAELATPGMDAEYQTSTERGDTDRGASLAAKVTAIQHQGASAEIVLEPRDSIRVAPGTEVNISLVLAERPHVTRIPLQSLVHMFDQDYCYLMTPAGFEQHPITIGLRGLSYVEVVEGLSAGDVIALDPKSLVPPSR